MSEMVERVARAIASAYNINVDALASGQIPQYLSHPRLGAHGAHLKFRDEDYMPIWKLFVPQALDAIKAMRDPTNAMIEAAHQADVKTDQYCASGGEHWQAMIDEAMK